MLDKSLKTGPVFVFLIAFSYGIFLGKNSEGLFGIDLFSTHLFFLFIFIVFFKKFLDDHPLFSNGCPKYAHFILGVGILLTFFIGYFHVSIHERQLRVQNERLLRLSEDDQKHTLWGYVLSIPRPTKKGARAQVKVFLEEGQKGPTAINGKVTISFSGLDWQDLRPGSLLRLRARLFPIRNFGTPGAFDFKNWWALRDILVRGYVKAPFDVVFLKGPLRGLTLALGDRIRIFLEDIRFRAIKNIFAGLDQGTSPVAMGLVMGERAWMEKRLKDYFSCSGLSHLFAVSGLHMAIVGGLIFYLTLWLLKRSSWLLLNTNIRKTAFLFSIMACALFCAISGLSPSSLRAFFMIAILGLGLFLEKRIPLENLLAVSAFILLLINPLYLFDLSFKFSFFVVFFLIYFGNFFKEKGILGKNRAFDLLIVTTVAFFISSLLSSYYFHRFNPLSLPLNLLAIPIVEFFALPAIILALFLSWLFPYLSKPLFILAEGAIRAMLFLLFHIVDEKWLDYFIIPPTLLELFLIISLFLLIPPILRRKRRAMVFSSLALTLLFATMLLRSYAFHQRDFCRLNCLDVGQGLCLVLELPRGRTMLFDTGGLVNSDFDMGQMIVSPFLRRIGVKKIDFMVISHPEKDHIGGAPSLLREFKVGKIFLNTDENQVLSSYKELMAISKEKGIPVLRISRLTQIRPSKDTRLLLIPCLNPEVFKGRNNRSLVTRLIYGKRAMLLPGDIEKRREAMLIKRGLDLKSLLLVVPHHGSKSSSSLSFIRKVSPKIALCSVGFRNMFHLPSKGVEKRYKRLNIPFLRTDICGTISVTVEKSGDFSLKTYYGKRDKKWLSLQ